MELSLRERVKIFIDKDQASNYFLMKLLDVDQLIARIRDLLDLSSEALKVDDHFLLVQLGTSKLSAYCQETEMIDLVSSLSDDSDESFDFLDEISPP